MTAIELTSKIELLPDAMRIEVEHYIEFLLSKSSKKKTTYKASVTAKVVAEPPIAYAAKPDVLALAGFWEKEKKTLEEIREKAWGKRK